MERFTLLIALVCCSCSDQYPEADQQSSHTTVKRESEPTPKQESRSVQLTDLQPEANEEPASQTQTSEPVDQEKPIRTLDEMLLFYPSRYPAGEWNPPNLDFEDVWFEAEDGTKLHGWYCPASNSRSVLLYSHGNGGHLAHRAFLLEFLQKELQVSVMIYDYRGYGRSEGSPNVTGILKDARAARTTLANNLNIPEQAIVLFGRSLGGAVAIELASEKSPRGLILESTFSSFRDVAHAHYPKLAWLVPRQKLNSIKLMERIDAPLLVSHGDRDQIIPYQHGQRLFEVASGPKEFVTIPNGDHNSPQSEEYYRAMERFLDTLPNREGKSDAN